MKRFSVLMFLSLCAVGCAARTVEAPPIIAAPSVGPVARDNAGTPIEPANNSTCLTWDDKAWCARWVVDGLGNKSLQFQQIRRNP